MNKIFKVIWNHATQSFVVASELSRNKGKVSSVNNDSLVLVKSTLALSLAGTALLGSALISIPVSAEAAVAIGSTSGSSTLSTAGVTATGTGNVVAIGDGAQATGSNAMAIGSSTLASGADATTLGSGSRASGGGSVALGKFATAGRAGYAPNTEIDLFTIAIGAYANATQNGAIAIGGHSQKNLASHAEGNNAIALGVNANATGPKATSIGSDSKAIGERALSLGDHTATNARYAMSIGAYARSTAENATSIGSLASASGQRAIAMGTNVSSSGYSAIAIGGDNLHNTVNVDVAGSKIADYTITQNQLTQAPKTQASATGSTAIGVNSVASEILSTVIGPLSTASGRGATAIGLSSNATKDAAVVLGVNSTASGLQAVVVGTASIASNESSVVLGSKSRSTGFQSVAVGIATTASGYTALAMGDQTNATSDHSTAIGFMANSVNREATAIGTAALASGIASFAAGSDANATANFTIAMGQNSNAKQENAIAIGVRADANGVDALAMGTGTKATEQSALALGHSANANIQNSVALGSSSTTTAGVNTNTATVNGLTYSGFAGNRVHSVVSVGSDTQKRQIQNVAAGQISTTSTDAINGSQLYVTQQVVGNVANSVKTVLGGNAALATTGAISTNNIGNTGKDTVHDAIAAVKENVVAGKNTEVTPAIATNGSTTYTVDAWNTTVTNGSAEVSVTSTTDNNNKVLAYTVDLSQATKNNITTANTTAHNANATANAANATANTALTEVKKGWNITTKANGGNVANNSTEQVSMGELVTFEAGKNINLTQNGANITIATSDKPTFNTVTTQNFNVQNGGKVDMGGNRITNVGTPTEANDAATKQYVDSGRTKVTSNDKSVTINKSEVNGADVYDLTVNANLNYTGDNNTQGTNKLSEKVKFAGTADEIVTEAKNGEVKFKLADKVTKDIKTNADNIAKGFGLQAEDNKSVTKQLGDVVPVVGANSNIKTLVENDKVKIALNNTLNLTDAGSVKLGDTTVNNGGVTITGGPSVTKNGIHAGDKKITNVSDGVDPNDAVNVGQLNKVNATANAGWKLTVNKQDANVSTVKPNATVSLNNEDGNILITKSADNNNVTFALNSTMSVGGLGKNGQPGKDGVISAKGADGQSGVTLNGKDGSIGLTGPAGQDGKPGASTNISVANGKPGVDGKDGGSKTRIVYDTKDENGNPVKEEVATLNDGLKFGANDVTEGVRKAKLNEQVDVKGATTNSDWKKFDEGQNVMTKVIDGNITIAIAKDLQGLNSITFTNGGTGKDVVLNGNGLNNGGNKITNVANGVAPTDAVNVSQLDKVNATANAGWNIAANGKNQTNVKPSANVSLNNEDGNILITKSDTDNNVTFALNNDLTIGGKDGVNGANGKDGKIGVKGADGKTGVTLNGKDGSIGLTGPAGQDGKPGASTNISVANGKPGVDGKDGGSKTRIVYDTKDENGNPVKEEVATLNDGLKFGANDVTGGIRKAKLNEQVDIKGAENNSDWAKFDAGQNVMTKVINGNITIAIAKDLQGLNSITFTNTNGAGKNVVLNGNGLNNGGNKITNVSDGVDPNDAVNVSQLDKVNATANAGWKLTVHKQKGNISTVTPNATVSLNNEDGNILITKSADNNNVTFALNNTLSVGGLGKDGKPGKDGVIGAKGADGKTGVTLNGKDGSIGINGKDGSNGTITLAKGKPGVDGKDGDTKTRITYQPVDEKGNPKGDPEHVATLNDGLKFVGDTGEVIKKKLSETLAIKGNLTAAAAVTDKNLRVDNVNGALILKMAKSLQELTNATFVDNAGNRSVIDGNGLTITPKAGSGKAPVSLTDKGLNNGGNQVTNVSSGLVDDKGKNVDLANATGDVLNNAVNVGDLKNSINNLTNATTGGFGLTGDDGKSAKADLGKTVTVQGDGSVVTKVVKGKDGKDALQVGLSNDVTIGNGKEPGKVTVKGENGKDGVVLNGKDGSAEFKDADGKTTVAINGKDGTIGLNGKDGVATKVDGNGVTITGGANGTVNLTDKGLNNGGNTITNVAAGVNATDAVNVSQLKDATAAATSKVEAGKNTVVTPTKNADGSTTYTVATKDEVDFTKVATGNTTMTNEGVKIGDLISLTENGLNNGGKKATNIADGDISATSKDAVNGSQLHATNQNVTNLQNTVAKGWNIEADTVDGSTGKVIGKSKAKVAMGDTVAVKAGNNIEITQEGKNIAIATSANPNFDSVKIGKGSNTAIISTTEDGAINVANANGGPTRITNVAAGKKDNDAVNVAQLKGAMSNINNNINAVNNKVDKVDRDLRAGIAGAMAAGNLYHVTIPGKSMVSAGIGTYKNQGAVAVGYSRLSDNGKIGVKFSVNTNTRGDSGAAASVGYQW
ncbi:YadA-like family protein [Actinobacillus equuli subsp. equuli]|uniref:YadA-like family protein n=1 Tax=Actinobacillus equuli TaxID=718 RepID=UPI002442F1A3|nr:YadA-like family protein [Actinobacillus equuli]WGE65369.1 YadA-like family protein [Actinobacillus equuli subsp. equuli]